MLFVAVCLLFVCCLVVVVGWLGIVLLELVILEGRESPRNRASWRNIYLADKTSIWNKWRMSDQTKHYTGYCSELQRPHQDAVIRCNCLEAHMPTLGRDGQNRSKRPEAARSLKIGCGADSKDAVSERASCGSCSGGRSHRHTLPGMASAAAVGIISYRQGSFVTM